MRQTFSAFRKAIMQMAKDESVPLRKIQSAFTEYCRDKYVPRGGANSRFVVRCSINGDGEVFKNASRCSYPPNKRKKYIGLQRANYPGQQVFYCSFPTNTNYADTTSTCLTETLWEHIEDVNRNNQYVTLSRWDLTRPLTFWVLPFAEWSFLKNRDMATIREATLKYFAANPEDAKSLELLQFLSELFCQRKNKSVCYRITAAFFNYLASRNRYLQHKLDGLLYPSANTEGAGVNLVLFKDIIDSGVAHCTYATMMKMIRHSKQVKSLFFDKASNDSHIGDDGRIRFTTIF